MSNFFYDNWTDIIVAFIGAFFGFGLALLIEYWNVRRSKKKEKEAIEDENQKKIEYYIILLKEVASKTQKQVELIQKNIKEQSENLLYPIPLTRISTSFFARLRNIDNRGVFEALAHNFKSDKDWVKKYSNLNSYLDFLEGVLCEELTRINKNTLEKGFKDQLYVKNLIDEIPNILSREAFVKKQILGDSRFENDEYVLIDDSIWKYRELADAKAHLETFNKELLEPLLEKYSEYEGKPYAQNVIFNCKNARVRMTDIKSDISSTISTYQQIITSLSEPIEKVKETIKLLEGKEKQY